MPPKKLNVKRKRNDKNEINREDHSFDESEIYSL